MGLLPNKDFTLTKPKLHKLNLDLTKLVYNYIIAKQALWLLSFKLDN